MNIRLAIYHWAQQHQLSPSARQQLWALSPLGHEPAAVAVWFWRSLAILAAALGGLGLILWISANWNILGRVGQFVLLQSFIAVTAIGAVLWSRARTPLSLLLLLGLGGLFAYFGQTYQTGADPWQLFALWTLLALPLCLGVRSDVLWTPWAVVACTGITLWVQARTGHQWRVQAQDFRIYLLAYSLAALVCIGLSPALQRFTGAKRNAMRLALTLLIIMLTGSGLAGLLNLETRPYYVLGLASLGATACLFARRAWFDIYALSTLVLGLNILFSAGLLRFIFTTNAYMEGVILLAGLLAAALLAASVRLILSLAQRANTPPATPCTQEHP